ncbi:MAG: ABC transporter permease [Chloroflexi bacterium]|nr:ABC transporter permease [Chloroflexota bacterium]
MINFIVGKIGQYVLVLWIAVTLNFALPRLMPGNPLALLAGEEVGMLTPQQRAQLMANVGLDQPLPAQYARYLQNLLRGDLGYSFQKNKPITTILADRLPWTLLLTVTSLLISTLIGITLGAAAAWQRGARGDVGLLGFFVFLESLPAFWIGMLLVALFAVQFPIFPTFGAITPWTKLEGWALVEDIVRHLVLPLTTLTIVSVSGTFIVARYSMLAVLGEDYIVVARAKGLRERVVLFRHALRNALLPIATVFTLNLAFAFGGATVVETVFSYPGVGRLVYEAVLNRDYPVLQAAFLMITVMVVVANILADAIYPFLDPRVRHAQSRGGAQ